MSVLKRSQIVTGFKVKVVHVGQRCLTPTFLLDAYLAHEHKDSPIVLDEQLEVVRGPHERHGARLVEVKRLSDGTVGKVFLTDFIHRCEAL